MNDSQISEQRNSLVAYTLACDRMIGQEKQKLQAILARKQLLKARHEAELQELRNQYQNNHDSSSLSSPESSRSGLSGYSSVIRNMATYIQQEFGRPPGSQNQPMQQSESYCSISESQQSGLSMSSSKNSRQSREVEWSEIKHPQERATQLNNNYTVIPELSFRKVEMRTKQAWNPQKYLEAKKIRQLRADQELQLIRNRVKSELEYAQQSRISQLQPAKAQSRRRADPYQHAIGFEELYRIRSRVSSFTGISRPFSIKENIAREKAQIARLKQNMSNLNNWLHR